MPSATSAQNARQRRVHRSLPALWVFVVPALGFLLFGSTGHDDSYITYWVADQLRRTGKIANYNGSSLEQSSSLLHVLLLAGTSWVTRIPVTTVGPWLGIVFGGLCAFVAYWLCDRLDPRARWMAAALVATLPPLVYWSFGGLETSLATFLLLLGVWVIIGRIEGSRSAKTIEPLVLLGVVLVRPEAGPVFVVALAVAAAAILIVVPAGWRGADGCNRTKAARRTVRAALVTAAWVIVVALFRRGYFGAWVPRPVSVKTGTAHIGVGFRYAFDTLVQSRTLVAVSVGAILLATRPRALTPGWVVAGALVATGTVAVIEPGGDWMEGGRLLAPWLALAVVLVAASLGRLSIKPRVAVACLLIAANGIGVLTYAGRISTGIAAWNHFDSSPEEHRLAATPSTGRAGFFERRNAIHLRDVRFIGRALPVFAALERVMAPRRVIYVSSQAGMVVYYLQQDAERHHRPFEYIDAYGLTDDTWDRCRDHLPSTSAGKHVSWARMLSGKCGSLPDVITGLGSGAQTFGPDLKDKYELFDGEDGLIESASWPKPPAVDARQWVAVRRDLAPKVQAELEREGLSR